MADGRTRAARAAKAAATGAAEAAKNGEVVEGVAEEVVDVADGAATALRGISEKSGNLGMGFLSAAGSLWLAAYSYSKFRQALGKPTIPVPPPS